MIYLCSPFGWKSSRGWWGLMSAAMAHSNCNTSKGTLMGSIYGSKENCQSRKSFAS